MNHPKPEEWVPYLYGEASGPARKELRTHLESCAQCRQEVETWKRSLHRLDTWKLSAAPRQRWALLPICLKWAAATAVVLLAGIWLGRATAPRVDTARLRAELMPEVRREIQQQTVALVREQLDQASALTLASSQRYADHVGQQVFVALKKDLDTLAVNAAAGLRSTEEQLVQLAEYKTPQIPGTPNP